MTDSHATPPTSTVSPKDISIRSAGTASDSSLPVPIEGSSGKLPRNLPSSIITVVRDPDHVLGKQFYINDDDTVEKQASVNLSLGIACMHQIDTHAQLAALLENVGNDPHAAIINSGFRGIEIGEEFVIASAKKISDLTGIPPSDRAKQQGVHAIDHNGKSMKMVGRFKENVVPSSWQYLDRDIDQHTADQFSSLDQDEFLQTLEIILPGIADTNLVSTASTSSRVFHKGKPVGSGNGHLWFKVKAPSDVERFRTAILIQAANAGLTWLKPRFSRTEQGKIVGHSLTTLIDTSVFNPGRLIFVGKPGGR